MTLRRLPKMICPVCKAEFWRKVAGLSVERQFQNHVGYHKLAGQWLEPSPSMAIDRERSQS